MTLRRYTTIMGRLHNAASRLAVPDATSTTSAAIRSSLCLPVDQLHRHFGSRAPQRLGEDLAGRGTCHRRDELHVRALAGHPAGGSGEILRQPRHFPAPAARQQRDNGDVCAQLQGGARLRAINDQRNGVRQRVSDKFGRHAAILVKPLLKRQQAQHQIDRSVNVSHSALAPCPHLRAHVLHRRDSGGAQIARKAQIEFWGIDADENVRPGAEKVAPDARTQLEQPRQVAQNLEQPHDRERFGRLPRLAARGLHFRTGDAEELCLRRKPLERRDQRRAQRIARRFARH